LVDKLRALKFWIHVFKRRTTAVNKGCRYKTRCGSAKCGFIHTLLVVVLTSTSGYFYANKQLTGVWIM